MGEGVRGIALHSLDDGTRRGGWSAPRPDSFTPGKTPVLTVQEAEWTPGPVWTGAENLAPTGIRSPDPPACSQSLYRLSYPGPNFSTSITSKHKIFQIMFPQNNVDTQTHKSHGARRDKTTKRDTHALSEPLVQIGGTRGPLILDLPTPWP
jgi:hypothetical protein